MKKYITITLTTTLLLTAFSLTGFSIDDLSELTSLTGAITLAGMEEQMIISQTTDLGSIELTFCPEGNCEEMLIDFINSAEETLHCAFYEVGLESLKEALINKEQEIEVQVVVDNNYFDEFAEDFVMQDGYAYMHNKFCIADNNRIITGSMNPTENGVDKNDNNLLIIESTTLAANFEAEFQELWNEEFKKGDPNAIVIQLETINQETKEAELITIESYFCPDDDCASEVETEIQAAIESIYFMTFSFTHEGIANNILIKHEEENLDIRGVFESRMNSEYSKRDVFDYQGIPVLNDGNGNTMHHKVFIIDSETVITGSMNPSNNGVDGNDETLLIIHSESIGAAFIEEFERVWLEAAENAESE